MSICDPCLPLQPISLCTDAISIGMAPQPSSPYIVYFRSLANGATYSYAVTSDSNKNLTLDLPDGFPLAEGHGYEMWATESGLPIECKVDLTINNDCGGNNVTATCFIVTAIKVFDIYSNTNRNYAIQYLNPI